MRERVFVAEVERNFAAFSQTPTSNHPHPKKKRERERESNCVHFKGIIEQWLDKQFLQRSIKYIGQLSSVC